MRQDEFGLVFLGAIVLCFNSGYVNSLTFNTVYEIASTHVTGVITLSSIALYKKHYTIFFYFVMNYLLFLVGSITSGVFIYYDHFHLGRRYGKMLILIGLIQILGLVLETHYPQSIYFVWCCSLTSGMQNALTSKYSKNLVRSTHMTGCTTDFGLIMGHALIGKDEETWKLPLLGCSILGFFFGGLLGTFVYDCYTHFALLFSIITTISAGIAHMVFIYGVSNRDVNGGEQIHRVVEI